MSAFSSAMRAGDLHGSVAFVTGASSGIGAHAARLLAQAGARVALAARRVERLQAVADELRAGGAVAEAVACDVTDAAAVQAAFLRAQAALGPATILINNAGIGRSSPALELSDADWRDVIETNLTAPFVVARTFANLAVANGSSGAIVNVASIAGLRPGGALAAYGVSKAGLIYLTEALALEWARYRIRVNALAPGYVRTELNAEFLDSGAGEAIAKRIPMRRLGRLEDLDGAILFLASDASAYVTGVTLPVDGGHLVSSL